MDPLLSLQAMDPSALTLCCDTVSWVKKCFPSFDDAALNESAKRNTRFRALADRSFQRFLRQFFRRSNALLRTANVAGIAFNADEVPPQLLGNSTCCAGSKKRIEHKIASAGG